MNDKFYKLALKTQNERISARHMELNSFENNCKMIVVLFKIWCLAFEKNETNYKNFNLFLKTTNREITFWQKIHIFEKEFGFTFNFNYISKKWEVIK